MAGELIRQMGYVAFATPDPEAGARDLVNLMGLRTPPTEIDGVYVSSNERVCELAYLRAAKTGIVAVGLEAMDAGAVDEVQERAAGEGLEIIADTPAIPKIERAVRFATPFGPVFEVHTPVPRDRPRSFSTLGVRRLDHVNLRASDTHGMCDLLTKVLGLKLSDRTTNFERAWYRAWDGFHHTIAVGEGTGFHHYAFDAYNVEAIVALADGLAAEDRRLLWGPGRHGAGDNLFSYYADPNDCVAELSWGMERIEVDSLREPRVWGVDSPVLNLWGGPPPPEYGAMLTPFVSLEG